MTPENVVEVLLPPAVSVDAFVVPRLRLPPPRSSQRCGIGVEVERGPAVDRDCGTAADRVVDSTFNGPALTMVAPV